MTQKYNYYLTCNGVGKYNNIMCSLSHIFILFPFFLPPCLSISVSIKPFNCASACAVRLKKNKQMVSNMCVLVTGTDKPVWKSILPELSLPTVPLFVVQSPISSRPHAGEIYTASCSGIISLSLPYPTANPINHILISAPLSL